MESTKRLENYSQKSKFILLLESEWNKFLEGNFSCKILVSRLFIQNLTFVFFTGERETDILDEIEFITEKRKDKEPSNWQILGFKRS